MTRQVEGNFWCCAGSRRPFEILFHSPVRRSMLLMAGSLFVGSFSPLLFRSKRAAKAEADEWNAQYDDADLRVAPRRIRITIEIDDGKEKEARDAKAKA